MDLRLYSRVLWRFRYLVAGGLVLACLLGFLTAASVGSSGVHWRTPATWQSSSVLLLTQPGFPVGRSVFPQVVGTQPGKTSYTQPYADPGRFAGLADVYAQLAASDAVHRRMLQDGPVPGQVTATSVTGAGGSGTLPMIRLTGTATTAGAATLTAQRGAQAFLEYLGSQQRAAGIPPKQRVVVQTVSAPNVRTATLVQGHKKTMPVLVFLAVALATVGAAFALENMRPAPAAARSDAGHPEPRVVEDAFGSAS